MNNIRINPACVGTPNKRIGCDLGYRSHKTRRGYRQVKCKGSMNFKNRKYELDCKPNKKANIKCEFSTNIDFSTYGKRQLTNKRYKKKRMAYLNCVDNTVKKKTKKSNKKSNKESNLKQKELNKQYELLLNGLYDYFKDKDEELEQFLKNRKTIWMKSKSKKATESSIKSLLIKTGYQYIPKGFQNILEGGK
jgi:hypothetical protein